MINTLLSFNLLAKSEITLPGIDVLRANNFEQLRGKNVGLLTNYTGRTSDGISTVEVFNSQKVFDFECLFVPEHGFYSAIPAGATVPDDIVCGKKCYSLYNKSKKPAKDIISKLNVIVIDIQDIGIRSYTYISTVLKTMEVAADNKIKVLILDRPNPLGGDIIDGNTVEQGLESFVGIAPIAYIHGCTIGELALMINGEGWLNKKSRISKKCDLELIKMMNWNREMRWEDTGLQWYPTSPHIPTVDAARGAAFMGLFGELGVISIGIGTTSPFQYIGNTSMTFDDLKELSDNVEISGIDLVKTRYRPFYGMYNGKDCNGYLLKFKKNKDFKPFSEGIEFFYRIFNKYPDLIEEKNINDKSKNMFRKVSGSSLLLSALAKRDNLDNIRELSNHGLENYIKIRAKYLQYE